MTVESLIESMRDSGIAHSVVCGFPWRDAGLCDLHNDYLRDAVARFPAHLSWLGIVSPEHGDRSGQVAADVSAGRRGSRRAERRCPELRDGVSSAGECIRGSDRSRKTGNAACLGADWASLSREGTATPDRLLQFLELYPKMYVVAAHWGGGLPFYELMPEVRALTSNVVYDSAATTYLYGFQVFRAVIDLVGQERVLFASDYPVLGQHRLVRRVIRGVGRRERSRGRDGRQCRQSLRYRAGRVDANVIAGLTGTVVGKSADSVLIDVNGVIYRVGTSTTTDRSGERAGTDHPAHPFARPRRPDGPHGFASRDELQLFETLITVTGVGPKTRLLDPFPADGRSTAKRDPGRDADLMATVPGVGRKTAARLIVDLRGKLPAMFAGGVAGGGQDDEFSEALRSLGYTPYEIAQAVAGISDMSASSVEDRVVAALQFLSSNQ